EDERLALDAPAPGLPELRGGRELDEVDREHHVDRDHDGAEPGEQAEDEQRRPDDLAQVDAVGQGVGQALGGDQLMDAADAVRQLVDAVEYEHAADRQAEEELAEVLNGGSWGAHCGPSYITVARPMARKAGAPPRPRRKACDRQRGRARPRRRLPAGPRRPRSSRR